MNREKSFFQKHSFIFFSSFVCILFFQAPEGPSSEVPSLPEADAKVLRNHLKQVLSSMSFQPIKNFDELPAESLSKLKEQQQQMDLESPGPQSSTVYPFLFGNDVDSVDVATRVAMVKFFNSANLLANFPIFTRTLRLYPRPIVTVQTQPLLRSRGKPSAFMLAFSETQSVECFAEWSLMPSNTAYLRVQNGVYDPTLVGDKPKWYASNLKLIEHSLWPDSNKVSSILRSFQVLWFLWFSHFSSTYNNYRAAYKIAKTLPLSSRNHYVRKLSDIYKCTFATKLCSCRIQDKMNQPLMRVEVIVTTPI